MQKRSDKEQVIKDLHEKFAKAQVAVVVEPQGINVETITELRKKFRDSNIEYKVVKNTLARRAAKGTPAEVLEDLLAGQTALVMGFEDPVTPAKVLQAFVKDNKAGKMSVKGAVVNGNKVDAKGVEELAKMPGLQELRAIIAGLLTQPAQQIAVILQKPAEELARVMQAKSEKA